MKKTAIFTAETRRRHRGTQREAPGFSPGVFGTQAADWFHRRENKEIEG